MTWFALGSDYYCLLFTVHYWAGTLSYWFVLVCSHWLMGVVVSIVDIRVDDIRVDCRAPCAMVAMALYVCCMYAVSMRRPVGYYCVSTI